MIMVGAKRRRTVDCSLDASRPWLAEQVLREKCFFSLPGVDYIRIYEYYADKMGCPGIFV